MMKKEVIRHHFPLVDSTNHWLKEHCDVIPYDQVVLVTAEEQIAGRGRQGHLWKSPKGVNLYASFGLRWDQDMTTLPLATAVAVAKVLEKLGFEPKLKWPNDILLNGKKVSGVLCEAIDSCIIIGIGLNINMTQEQLNEIDQPATSLLAEKGQSLDIEEVTSLISASLIESLDQDPLPEYKARLAHQEGDKVAFHDDGFRIEGTFAGLDEKGFLKLTLPDGSSRTFNSGHLM